MADAYSDFIAQVAPLVFSWPVDLNGETNPYLLERFGINGTFNVGAIKLGDKYLLIVRAWNYFNLVRTFGTVPVQKQTVAELSQTTPPKKKRSISIIRNVKPVSSSALKLGNRCCGQSI